MEYGRQEKDINVKSEKGTGFGEVAPIPFFKTETIDEAQAFIGHWGMWWI